MCTWSPPPLPVSLARVVSALGVALQLLRVEIHLAQCARGVAYRLVIEVRRGGVPAPAARRDRHCVHLLGELDHRDEAVARRAVIALGALVAACLEGGERAPRRCGEGYRRARLVVIELLHDVAVVALEAIDRAPFHPP